MLKGSMQLLTSKKPTAAAYSGYTGRYQHSRTKLVNMHSYLCIIVGDMVNYDWYASSSPVDVPVISNTGCSHMPAASRHNISNRQSFFALGSEHCNYPAWDLPGTNRFEWLVAPYFPGGQGGGGRAAAVRNVWVGSYWSYVTAMTTLNRYGERVPVRGTWWQPSWQAEQI